MIYYRGEVDCWHLKPYWVIDFRKRPNIELTDDQFDYIKNALGERFRKSLSYEEFSQYYFLELI